MNFWKTKTLPEMTTEEWESLCDGCAKCCLHKLEDEDTGNVYFTSVACQLMDLTTCRCTRYTERTKIIPDCVDIRKLPTEQYYWLPVTCAYRLIHEGKDLPEWHPLLSKTAGSVEEAGISIRAYARLETPEDDVNDLEDFILDWLE
ncbi:MAG: YcgN family cysteine cluster protein [Methylococcales bacterium]|nr:YcgN family cysteine cluster protein [Methylococcales bacterium]